MKPLVSIQNPGLPKFQKVRKEDLPVLVFETNRVQGMGGNGVEELLDSDFFTQILLHAFNSVFNKPSVAVAVL